MGFRSNGIKWIWDDKSTTSLDWDEPVINMKDTISDEEIEEVKKELKNSKLEVKTVPPMHYGWVCPKCGRVNAPWVTSCICVAPKWEITC